MKLQIFFTNLESTDAIKEKIEKKAHKLKKYFQGPVEIKWTCSIDKGLQTSNVIVSGDGKQYNASSSEDHLYKTFDEIIAKIEKQHAKTKSQRLDHSHHPSTKLSDLMIEEEDSEQTTENF